MYPIFLLLWCLLQCQATVLTFTQWPIPIIITRHIDDLSPVPLLSPFLNITICLSVPPTISRFQYSAVYVCDIVTLDCNCYSWQSTVSNQRCLTMPPKSTPSTLIWRLSHRTPVPKPPPPIAMYTYSHLHLKLHHPISLAAFTKLWCASPIGTPIQPPAASISYTFSPTYIQHPNSLSTPSSSNSIIAFTAIPAVIIGISLIHLMSPA